MAARNKQADNIRLLRTVLDSAGEGVYGLNLKGHTTFVNITATEILGYTKEEMLGVNQHSLIHHHYPDGSEYPRKDCKIYKAFSDGKVHTVRDEVFWHKDGTAIPVKYTSSPLRDEKGKIVGAVVVFRDISQQVNDETARKEAEEKFKLITDNSSDIIALRNTQGKVLYVTPSFERQLGFDSKKEIGKSSFRLTHPEDRKLVEKKWKQKVLKEKKSLSTDLRLRNSKGEYQWFESISDPVLDASGKVIAVVATSRNITQYKETESQALQLGRIVEDSLNEIYVFDSATLKFISVNRGARKNLGYSLAALQKMTPVNIKPKFTKKAFLNLVKPLLEGKKEQIYFETIHQRKDGTEYDVEVYLQLSKTGLKPAFVAIIEDITDKKAAQERLQQAHKMEAVGNLSGGIAHDFNNLLTAIQGSLQLIEMLEKDLSKEAAECLGIALKSTKRGAELTSKLLAFSRKQTLEPVVVEVKTKITELIALLKRTIDESIGIEAHFIEREALVKLDESLLENALLNLSVNARDAMPKGGHLIFEVSHEKLNLATAVAREILPGDYIVISISDSGDGISEKVKGQIFEPFFSTKDLEKGTGLGLSMVYGFVKQSGGYINVYSEEGIGTTFKLYFREVEGQPGEKIKSASSQASTTLASGTILLVEDDEGVMKFVSGALKAKGYKVLEAMDGPSAKKIMSKTGNIDLLLTDVVLPKGMSGVDVGKVFTKNFPGNPIIYSSGYTEKAAGAPKSLLPKREHLLSKPYDLQVLFDLVEERLSKG